MQFQNRRRFPRAVILHLDLVIPRTVKRDLFNAARFRLGSACHARADSTFPVVNRRLGPEVRSNIKTVCPGLANIDICRIRMRERTTRVGYSIDIHQVVLDHAVTIRTDLRCVGHPVGKLLQIHPANCRLRKRSPNAKRKLARFNCVFSAHGPSSLSNSQFKSNETSKKPLNGAYNTRQFAVDTPLL